MWGAEFIENDDGIHVMDPVNAEFTLCGDAWDAPDSEGDWEPGAFRKTRRKTVTCERCARIIMALRGIRVARLSQVTNGERQ